MTCLSVLVVDDHAVFAEALQHRLRQEPRLNPVRVATSTAEALALVHGGAPDVAVLDATLGAESGIRLAERLKSAAPGCQIVMLSAVASPSVVAEALRAGARAWLSKTAHPDELVKAIRGVMRGEAWLSPTLLGAVLPVMLDVRAPEGSRHLGELTAREQEILQYMVDGLTRSEIGDRLGVSAHTVRTHTQNLFTKLEAHSTLEAVAIGLRSGLRASDT
jgi:two-component system NarL family response regulator